MKKLTSFLRGKKKLTKTILVLALPAIIEMALNTMLGVADTIMISHFLGADALAAVGFANQIIFSTIFIFSSFNTGAVALISRAYGEKAMEKLVHIAEQNVMINLLIGFFGTIILYMFRFEIFKIFDISDIVYQNAVDYFSIVVIGSFPVILSFAFGAILRGAGDTKTPMKITGVVNVLNIIGNYVLILGVGPFPEMGIKGAALATTISRTVAVIMYVNILYFKNNRVKLKFKFFFDKVVLKPLWNISLPGAVEQFLMQLSFIIIGITISQLDTVAEASSRVLFQIESLSFMPAIGCAIATATLVGKALGEKDIEKAANVGYISSLLGIVWGMFMCVFFFIFATPVLKLFTSDFEIIKVSKQVLPFLSINLPLLQFVVIMSGALRGAGDTKAVMIFTTTRVLLVFVPLAYLFIIPLGVGLAGLWIGEIISMIIFSIILFRRFYKKSWVNIEI